VKTFIFKYEPNSTFDQLLIDFKNAIQTKLEKIDNNIIISPSIDAILSSMNRGRLNLFYCIAKDKPSSLYHLSKILKRDYSNVLRDAKALEEMGIIQLKKSKKNGREFLEPIALYDCIIFEFKTCIQFKRKQKTLKKRKSVA
jgi:predicted transcriptional regulator